MNSSYDFLCNRVFQSFDLICDAMMALHGRGIYNMFSLYGQEIQRDIHDLIHQGYMDTELRPRLAENTVILPGLSSKNVRRMRYAWDYFVYIYMSHKIQNIKRRQVAFGSLDLPTILYLRGTDYELAVSQEGAGVGAGTTEDFNFNATVLNGLQKEFNVLKALSPSDLKFAMVQIGNFLDSRGNFLSSVAEFARAYDGGVFFNPVSWKERVLDLFPSASLYLVYVSNQSNGLSYELESPLDRGLAPHAILVLDEGRFGSRDSFFSLQERLREAGNHLYLSVVRDACAVEDTDAFEQLVARFPHTVTLKEDWEEVQREIEALIPAAQRREVDAPAEFPFEFRVNIDAAQDERVAALRQHVASFIEESISQDTFSNWPVLLVHLEMDIFLNLAFGRILEAGLSTAQYAAIADFMLKFVKENAPARLSDLGPVLEQCGNIAMNVGYDSFALGEWNDYSNRRELSKDLVDVSAHEIEKLMRLSVRGVEKVVMREAKEDAAHEDASAHADLLMDVFKQFAEDLDPS